MLLWLNWGLEPLSTNIAAFSFYSSRIPATDIVAINLLASSGTDEPSIVTTIVYQICEAIAFYHHHIRNVLSVEINTEFPAADSNSGPMNP